LILNSGNANACTGQKGIEDAMLITEKVAEKINTNKEYVFPLSTGVIGLSMPMDRILPALDELVSNIGKVNPSDVASAIMTTDNLSKINIQTD